MKALMSAKQNQ